jgi:hypothetical protein
MGIAEDLKALQELLDKGELSESAYATARDAAIGKLAFQPTASVKSKSTVRFVVNFMHQPSSDISVKASIDAVGAGVRM